MFIWTDKPFILLPKCQEKAIPDDSCNVCSVILVLLYREQSLRDNSGNSLWKDFENSLQEGVGRFGPCLRKWECLIFEESSLPLSWQAVLISSVGAGCCSQADLHASNTNPLLSLVIGLAANVCWSLISHKGFHWARL